MIGQATAIVLFNNDEDQGSAYVFVDVFVDVSAPTQTVPVVSPLGLLGLAAILGSIGLGAIRRLRRV